MTLHIGMLLYPGLTQLDLTGPYEVLHRIPDSKVHLVWKEIGLVKADSGIQIYADANFASCPPLDVVFVPGGLGQIDLMADAEVLDFLRKMAANARYVTSVCTGALLLGAAGLLEGYESTTHWAYHDMLSAFGAKPVKARRRRSKSHQRRRRHGRNRFLDCDSFRRSPATPPRRRFSSVSNTIPRRRFVVVIPTSRSPPSSKRR